MVAPRVLLAAPGVSAWQGVFPACSSSVRSYADLVVLLLVVVLVLSRQLMLLWSLMPCLHLCHADLCCVLFAQLL